MQSQILPSRAALVDRIALQFEYGQNLIVLLGTSGLGKSYLLETFITDKYADFNKAFVQVFAKMTDSQLMSELLEQSFNSPLVDHNLSLSENYYQLQRQQPCDACLWVLDGGKHLSAEMLEQLDVLSKTAPNTLYIMLASQSRLNFKDSVNINLEPLNIAESKKLMGWYFNSLPYDDDPIFNAFLAEARGNPSLLLAWYPSEQMSNVVVKDKVSWRLHFLSLMLIIMLLIIGYLYKPDMTQWWQQKYQQAEVEVISTALPVQQITNSTTQLQRDSTKVDKSSALVSATITVPNNDVSAIVESLYTNESNTSPSLISPDSGTLHGNLAAPVELLDIEQKETQIQSWYLQQPDTHYVIQLLAVTQKQVSDKFIAKNALQGKVNIYQTTRNNQMWWVVTLGSFSSINDAKQVLISLSPAVKKNQPFYKKISKIKQEIARVER